jgi:hypothetical protein
VDRSPESLRYPRAETDRAPGLNRDATTVALASSRIERMSTPTPTRVACAICRRAVKHIHAVGGDGRPHCRDCALLVAIARAMVRASA